MRVVVYGANWCGPCQKVKEELEAAGIQYVFRDIDSNPTFKQYVADIQNTIPMVQVESNHGNCVTIGGYHEKNEPLQLLKFTPDEM